MGEWFNPGEPVLRIVRVDLLRIEGFLKAADYSPQDVTGKAVSVEVELPRGGREKFEGDGWPANAASKTVRIVMSAIVEWLPGTISMPVFRSVARLPCPVVIGPCTIVIGLAQLSRVSYRPGSSLRWIGLLSVLRP